MPSVSNISIGANMAAASATKARHGMNESIARLSTGIAAMYGGNAAGQSIGTTLNAVGKSHAMAARNTEDGISFLQSGEAVLLEVGNLLIRARELGIAVGLDGDTTSNANAVSDRAALDAEAAAIFDTIEDVLNNTAFNGTVVVNKGNASAAVAIGYSGNTTVLYTAGPEQSIAVTNTMANASAAATFADARLGEVAKALGNIAADLTALKSMQAVASATGANLVAAGARVMDTDFAVETAQLTKNSILNQAAMAMAAQANQAQSAILSVLQ